MTMSFASPRPGALLYHYTSADAFLGIAGTHTLWATDIRFLNDTAEFTFARDLLARRLLERTHHLRNERMRRIMRQELEGIAVRTVSAYVVSFSERGNSLSQWRAYAPRDGVSIGFHRGALRAIKDFALWKCFYAREPALNRTERRGVDGLAAEVDDALRWASRLLQAEWRKKAARSRKSSTIEKDYVAMVEQTLVWAALRLKHSGFAEEREWRLIDNRDPGTLVARGTDALDGTHFRRGAFGVTPYLVAALPERWRTAPLGIAEVIVGPSSNTRAVVASIQDFLSSKLRSRARVVSCDIPYRAW